MVRRKNLKITVKKYDVDWLDIKNACRQTISMGDSSIEPTDEWKEKLLIARHSPLRIGTFLIQIEDIPFYVMGHLVRHNVGVTPFVSTSREDRTGVPREERKQTDLVSMQMVCNIEALMNISEKRLCTCADKETLKVWKAVLEEVKKCDEAVYEKCVPSCVAHGGCIELFGDCTYYENLMKGASMEEQMNLPKRYERYNARRK